MRRTGSRCQVACGERILDFGLPIGFTRFRDGVRTYPSITLLAVAVSLPYLFEILESLEVVVPLQPGFHSELRQDCHHVSQWEPGEFGGLAE